MEAFGLKCNLSEPIKHVERQKQARRGGVSHSPSHLRMLTAKQDVITVQQEDEPVCVCNYSENILFMTHKTDRELDGTDVPLPDGYQMVVRPVITPADNKQSRNQTFDSHVETDLDQSTQTHCTEFVYLELSRQIHSRCVKYAMMG